MISYVSTLLKKKLYCIFQWVSQQRCPWRASHIIIERLIRLTFCSRRRNICDNFRRWRRPELVRGLLAVRNRGSARCRRVVNGVRFGRIGSLSAIKGRVDPQITSRLSGAAFVWGVVPSDANGAVFGRKSKQVWLRVFGSTVQLTAAFDHSVVTGLKKKKRQLRHVTNLKRKIFKTKLFLLFTLFAHN